MKNRRRAAAAGASVLGALALTGCNLDTKPTALVTVVSGSESQHTEAQCRNIEATTEALSGCLDPANGKKPKVLKVDEGNTVNVGVEPDVADSWGIVYMLPGDSSFNEVGRIKDQTYAKALTIPSGVFSEAKSFPLAVVNFKDDGAIESVWSFELKKK